jgi:predicted LPLAT superfamily acyltransferase
MSQHWAQIKEAGFQNGMRLMVLVYQFLGRTVFNIVLIPVMLYFLVRRTGARRSSIDFLKKVQRRYPDTFPKRPVIWLSFLHSSSVGAMTRTATLF